MDKVIDIKKVLEKTALDTPEKDIEKAVEKPSVTVKKTTNPILKKLAKFKNENLSKKFDINDLLR